MIASGCVTINWTGAHPRCSDHASVCRRSGPFAEAQSEYEKILIDAHPKNT
jgi:hypothetical protein